jgi:hypothetical protein
MKMKEVVERLFVEFGPEDTTDPSPMVKRILAIMPNKDVPDDVFRKVVSLGNVLKGAGVPR